MKFYWKVAAQTLLRMFYPSDNLKHSVFYELQNLNEYKHVIEGLHGGRKYWEEYRLSEIESIESTPDYFDDQMSRGHKLYVSIFMLYKFGNIIIHGKLSF